MIKFSIFLQSLGRGRCKFRKVLGKCQNYRFPDIFWDILDKRMSDLGQECAKNWTGNCP